VRPGRRLERRPGQPSAEGDEMGAPALLVIDVQNDFCSPEGALAQRGEDLTSVQEAVGNIEALLKTARAHAAPRIFVRVVHNDWLEAGNWGERHRGAARPRSARKAEEGTWGSELYRVQPQPDEIVLTKTRYSAFVGTPLRQVLHGAGIDELVLTGTQTDVCILTTALDGVQEGFKVNVVSDCVASPRQQLHEAALEIARIRAGCVVGLDEARRLFESHQA
jgi:ureidoacrylate peracid hydrolase